MLVQAISDALGQPLDPNKQQHKVNCPWHDDRTPSLSINVQKGFMCFGCDKKGSIGTLIRLLGSEVDRADLALASVSRDPEPEPTNFGNRLEDFKIAKATTPEALAYCREKGISLDAIWEFRIRHNGRGILVMPYYDGDRVVAIRYRARDGSKSYEPGSERTIYNLNALRGSSTVILCEGESDTHAIWSKLGNTGTVAVGGLPGANHSVSNWETYSLDLMYADKVYIAFDNDEAGEHGYERAASIFGERTARLAPPEGYNDWSEAILSGVDIRISE